MKPFIIILILFIISYYSKAMRFNNDSLKNKYELNDPRNPNCPCHKYQKLADEEYKKLNQKNIPIALRVKEGIDISASNTSPNSSLKTKHFKIITLFYHKNITHNFFNFNKRHCGKKKHFLRNNKNVSSCFHWR